MRPRLRSVLFAPASRPEVLAKLPRSSPDAVVIDLEDAVPADGKAAARVNVTRVGPDLTTLDGGPAVFVRVNAVATEWFAADIAEGLCDGLAGVMVPKLESAGDVATVTDALAGAGRDGLGIVAGIETAAGLLSVSEVLGTGPVDGAYFGAEDFVADMGGVRREDNLEVLHARSHVVLAARVAGVAAIDMVVADFTDADRFEREALEARALGFAGKLCIHPAQVPLANESFVPTAAEVERAEHIVAAYEQATAEGHAAVAVDGQMVDEPLARQARAVLAAAD